MRLDKGIGKRYLWLCLFSAALLALPSVGVAAQVVETTTTTETTYEQPAPEGKTTEDTGLFSGIVNGVGEILAAPFHGVGAIFQGIF